MHLGYLRARIAYHRKMLAVVAAWLLQGTSSIDEILADPVLEGATVAVTIANDHGELLYDRNGDRRMVPASNQKIITAAFALDKLGPTFQNQTRLWKEKDRLVIDAPGNPMITYSEWQDAVSRVGGRTQLPVAVRQAYRVGFPDGWEIDDLPNRYAAPVTALTTERSGFELWTKDGRPELRPHTFGVRIETTASPSPLTFQFDPFQRLVRISGSLPKGEQRLDTLSIPDPDLAVASLFGDLVTETRELPARTPDVTIQGKTIADLIAIAMPVSDNQICEHLLLMTGGTNYAVARASLTDFLVRRVGISKASFRVMDGSGLSRHNLLTSRMLVQLLAWADRQPTAGIWRRSLPHPGVGTLSTRQSGIDFVGKTGTMSGISSLSGYLRTASGKNLTVSFLFNNYLCTATEARAIQDRILVGISNDELRLR